MDSLFFIASKVFWTLARPESWILLLLALSAIALWRGRSRGGSRFLFSGLALLLAVGMLPLGELLLRPLETWFPRNPEVTAPAGILVLGGGESAKTTRASGRPEINEAGDRFLAAIALARAHPQATLLFTGGSGHLLDQGVSGADVAERIFEEAGVAGDRLLLERASRNTAENAVLSRDLVGERAGGPWILVTSAFHMPRAVGSFCAAGWEEILPYPVDFRHFGGMGLRWDLAGGLGTLNLAVKEWIGLFAYRLTGRSEEFFTETC